MQRHMRGQAMVEYLLVAGTILALIMFLQPQIVTAANGLMAFVGNLLRPQTGTADQLLR